METGFTRYCLLRKKRNLELPFENYNSFSLEETEAVECNVNFRFKKNEILILARAIDIPENLHAYKQQFVKELKGCVFFYDDFSTLAGIATWFHCLADPSQSYP